MGSISDKKGAQLSAITSFVTSVILFSVGGILYAFSEKELSSDVGLVKENFTNKLANAPSQVLPNGKHTKWRKLESILKIIEYNQILRKEKEKARKRKKKLKESSKIIFIIGWVSIVVCPVFVCSAIYYHIKDKRKEITRNQVINSSEQSIQNDQYESYHHLNQDYSPPQIFVEVPRSVHSRNVSHYDYTEPPSYEEVMKGN
ncbi:DgyrCDS10828 [Dimorphilus gyrociliatus]|uniref:DgyrCDS10828 n=1 Tax=Dimorphilus gyrociliatus TaxID=2664684 RepID=A0A7I8W2U7_9ANNE|nr:DgyrCDS10828 [Dimorphilus gyrociliatus]